MNNNCPTLAPSQNGYTKLAQFLALASANWEYKSAWNQALLVAAWTITKKADILPIIKR